MAKTPIHYRPTVLLIIDGWGVAPDSPGNAIARARIPNMSNLITSYPSTTLVSYGDAVGLRWGEMGNSEVGHLNIGAGLVFYQNIPRLSKEIKDGSFFTNEVMLKAAAQVKENKSRLHLMGLVSSGGVHSHIDHLFALMEFAKKSDIDEVVLHVFLDGRDATYNSGVVFLADVQKKADALKLKVVIATMMGRFYAMDRDNRWDRTSAAYAAIVHGAAAMLSEETPEAYLQEEYAKKVYDEQVPPVVFTKKGKPLATLTDGDALIFFNFRSDRARQLSRAISVPGFDKVDAHLDFHDLFFATMVEYEKDLPVAIVYPPISIMNPLAKVISDAGLKQYHLAETEKYAHVTFFINGGREEAFPGEERKVIPSPKVASYDEKPEMSAQLITDDLLKKILADSFDFYVVNFANPDMVAHTGNLKATIRACEVVDEQVGRIVEAVLAKNGLLVVTADHGNAEELLNLQTEDFDKEHSTNAVPLILVAKNLEGQNLGLMEGVGADLSLVPPIGILADVAPTVLKLMGLEVSPDMTGTPLI